MNRISKMLLAFTACALCVAPAIAQDGTLKKIKDNGFITIGHRDASIPFSYYDDKQQPIGFAMDLCAKIVDAVKANLKMPNLQVKYQLVTSANRIPLIANGTVDLECGGGRHHPRWEVAGIDFESPPWRGRLDTGRERFRCPGCGAMARHTFHSGTRSAETIAGHLMIATRPLHDEPTF